MPIDRKIYIDRFDYHLPDERIARYPLQERDCSKLLVYRAGKMKSDIFSNLASYITPDSLMVFNNTRVIPARLLFSKPTGSIIEIFCLEPSDPSGYTESLGSKGRCTWKCIVGNLKRWKGFHIEKHIRTENKEYILKALMLSPGNTCEIEFIWNYPGLTFAEVIEDAGLMPIPPYLKRPSEEIDRLRYQTIYSRVDGSVAAPTAGLHFTDNVLEKLAKAGIHRSEITLHVGAGTFIPVKASTVDDHMMHTEHFCISTDTIRQLIYFTGKIVAVGTTTVRTLESLYWLGVKLKNDKNCESVLLSQWEAYDLPQNMEQPAALQAVLDYMLKNGINVLKACTQHIIIPGYRFRLINAMVTNFHQPKSTLLLLIAAFTGSGWKKIYDFALKNNFRFLSYGDSSLIYYESLIMK
jgi:S-adenosylmethionine:tRNA ribosyltransferase-isomerase